jgi:hypothetical protein
LIHNPSQGGQANVGRGSELKSSFGAADRVRELTRG